MPGFDKPKMNTGAVPPPIPKHLLRKGPPPIPAAALRPKTPDVAGDLYADIVAREDAERAFDADFTIPREPGDEEAVPVIIDPATLGEIHRADAEQRAKKAERAKKNLYADVPRPTERRVEEIGKIDTERMSSLRAKIHQTTSSKPDLYQ